MGKIPSGGGLVHRYDFDYVISIQNLLCAWKQFRKGKRGKRDVAVFELNLESNLFNLHEKLRTGTWQPDPYHVFSVKDPKQRIIHKASVRDRVVYQAVHHALYQIFDRGFIFHSYSSRKNKGTHAGVDMLERHLRKITRNYHNPAYTLKCDIKKFFDSIDHKILFGLISRKIKDQQLLALIQKILNSFCFVPGKGLPLGNVTSQLFANIYMNELDQYVKRRLRIHYYVRYCDDFVIVCDSVSYLKKYIIAISVFCQQKLLLELHPKKILLRKVHWGTDFLGYVLLPHRRVLRTRTKKRILKKIEELKNMAENGQQRTETVVQSYLGILMHCKGKNIEQKIERIFWD